MELLLPLLLLSLLSRSSSPRTLPEAAAAPILQDRPFVVVWNMPTAHCRKQYNVYLDLRDFDIVKNRQQDFQGQVIDPFTFLQQYIAPFSQGSLYVFIMLFLNMPPCLHSHSRVLAVPTLSMQVRCKCLDMYLLRPFEVRTPSFYCKSSQACACGTGIEKQRKFTFNPAEAVYKYIYFPENDHLLPGPPGNVSLHFPRGLEGERRDSTAGGPLCPPRPGRDADLQFTVDKLLRLSRH